MFSFVYVNQLTLKSICQNIDMSQGDAGIELETSLGYLLKEASSALRLSMEQVLRPSV